MKWLILAAGLAAAAPVVADPVAAEELTVVELFTSEACVACPPADRLLAGLADRDDILALGFHVDYWNRAAARDPFALRQSTLRQRRYAAALGQPNLFTPQMIIDGRQSVTGSQTAAVLEAIETAPASERVPVIIVDRGNGRALITIGAGGATPPADILLIHYADQPTGVVLVADGPGHGAANVVRSIQKIGEWRGPPVSFDAPIPAGREGGLAVLVQPQGTGPYLGVGRLELAP